MMAWAVAGRAVLIVNIDHQVMPGRLVNGFVEPCRPALRADLDEAILYALDPPFISKEKMTRKTPEIKLCCDKVFEWR